jgi:hypothetical protein
MRAISHLGFLIFARFDPAIMPRGINGINRQE